MKDLQIAFFKSNVPYQDYPQDLAIFAGLYNYAVKHKIKYVLTGANNATESIRPPLEWVYMNDIRLLRDIHKKFGTVKLKTFPQCSIVKYRVWSLCYDMRKASFAKISMWISQFARCS